MQNRNFLFKCPRWSNTVHATGQDPSHTINCGLYLAVGAGALWLPSADPAVQPAMNYHYLEDPWDVQRLRDAVRLCVRLLDDPAFQAILDHRVSPTDAALATDAALDQWLLQNVTKASEMLQPDASLVGEGKEVAPAGQPPFVLIELR